MNLAILQARMSSSRMPGKVLRPILGEPMIVRQIERVRHAVELDEIVVATSVNSTDDILADTLEAHGVTVRRGPLDDVLSRFLGVVDEFDPDLVVRLTGDNPLLDPAVIDLVLREHVAATADYSSTGLSHTFPHGLDVEVVTSESLRRIALESSDPEEREHVTLGIYRRPSEFRLHAVGQAVDRSDFRWTVDYPADFDWVSTIFERLHPRLPQFGQEDVVALLAAEPALRRTRADAES